MPEGFFILGALGLIMAIPITAILTAHQRKMAAFLHDQPGHAPQTDAVMRLSREVGELRQLVAQQAIALDDLSALNRRLLERTTDADAVRERLNQ